MDHQKRADLFFSILSPMFLGMAPLFGKLAYQSGSDPFTVAAVRTVIAAAILWVLYLIFWRRYIFIYPAGLLGCIVIGVINGLGSLMFYTGLDLLDASLTQLLNGMYIVFTVALARIAGQRITVRIRIRLLLAFIALLLLTGFSATTINWLGVGLMLGNAIMFAGTMLLSQRVVYEMPSQTLTLYMLTTMAVVVTMARLAYGIYDSDWTIAPDALGAILLLGASTAAARLTMFFGVKKLGGLQTAMIAITEIGVTLVLAYLFLGERLTPTQWIGVAFLASGILLMRKETNPQGVPAEATPLPNMAGLTLFHQMAFDQAFGTSKGSVSPEELEAIRRMMGDAADQPPPSIPLSNDELPTAPQRPSGKDGDAVPI
ncbi:MAG: DMT family transporter [Anaerolineae bacterium]|nr:DMT family transporter [Anaerolineae bacterium]